MQSMPIPSHHQKSISHSVPETNDSHPLPCEKTKPWLPTYPSLWLLCSSFGPPSNVTCAIRRSITLWTWSAIGHVPQQSPKMWVSSGGQRACPHLLQILMADLDMAHFLLIPRRQLRSEVRAGRPGCQGGVVPQG